MNVPMNDLRRAFAEQRDEIESALLDVAASGWYVHGLHHQQFESMFASYLGVRFCIGVASGTDALELSLRALDDDSERRVVITAANAGGYTTAAVRSAGLTPRFADVDEATLCLSSGTVEPLLSSDVRAVVVTHLYGRLSEVEPLVDLCKSWGVPLMEDCAQAVGASRQGRQAGTFGAFGAFSFYPTKNLGALGDGGAIVTDDEFLATRVREMRQYGWSQKYQVERADGRNSRLDEIQAAILALRLPHLGGWNSRRRAIVSQYSQAARDSRLHLLDVDGLDHVAHLAVARCEDRDQVRQSLADNGVQTDVHYPRPDHMQLPWRTYGERQLPVTERAANEVLSLPCFPQMTDNEVEKVCDVIARL